MTSEKKRRRRPSLQSIYIHHILWGVVCVMLIAILLGMWYHIQSLNQNNSSLQNRLRTLSVSDPSCTARSTWQTGEMKTFTALTKDGPREYTVNLPSSFKPTVYYPLIVHFPGKGASVVGGVQQAGLNTLSAVVVYPHPTVGKDGFTSWQGAPYSSGVDDVAFTSTILDQVQSQLCIDRERVYATGMSNGGGMVSLLSCQLSDRFAAFGIVSGAMYYPAGSCTPQHPRAIISIHGDGDLSVPYGGSTARKLAAITTWATARAKENGCNPQAETTNKDITTLVTIWKNCTDNATVESIRIKGGGHQWEPDATQTLWQFMSKHSL